MLKIKYSLTLVSDAEPSSGFGSNLLDATVPRNFKDEVFLPASHIKGLMKQALQNIPKTILPEGFSSAVEDLFGIPGESFECGSLFSMSNCESGKKAKDVTKIVTRTKLNKFGVAADTSLRSSEVIATGTIFKGELSSDYDLPPVMDLILRFALLSIMEIGGNRNRGCGACYVKIEKENRKPGEILKRILESSFEKFQPKEDSQIEVGSPEKQILVKLTFEAESPLCLPELPIVGNNTIQSGYTIPASAVQGLVLTRINAVNSSVATRCFESPLFRAWPMLPVPENVKCVKVPVRASYSHKISKLADENKRYAFCDESVEPYDWALAPKNAPIKSADGVLIPVEGGVELWRSGDMARYLSAHGVINGSAEDSSENRRNLYTVEAIAERKFMGLLAIPEDALDLLKKSLSQNSSCHIGKAKTIRGSGKLEMEVLNSPEVQFEFPRNKEGKEVFNFIVQSPILIDDSIEASSANEILMEIVQKYWKAEPKLASASVQILFGWNRHRNGLQKAERVIAPGSVFCLEKKPENLQGLILNGLGEGRERGFGSVLPHPGIATNRYMGLPEENKVSSSLDYAKKGWALWEKSKDSGLMPSQIAQLQNLVCEKTTTAIAYLNRQRTERSSKIWDRWKGIFDDVMAYLEKDINVDKILKVWHDLSVAEQGGKK